MELPLGARRTKAKSTKLKLNRATLADRVKGSSKSNLKRPTCLNFRTKANLKRHEVIELLKEINFEPSKISGCG